MNPWGRGDKQAVYALGQGGGGEGEVHLRLFLLVLRFCNHCSRKGAGEGGCRRAGPDGLQYGDIASDAVAIDEGPKPTRTRGPGMEKWTTTIDASTTWLDIAPVDDAEVGQYNNQSVGARGYIH